MNMNQIINMVVRRVMSVAINKGINVGVDTFSKRKSGSEPDPADTAQSKQRLRQTSRMVRRMGRF